VLFADLIYTPFHLACCCSHNDYSVVSSRSDFLRAIMKDNGLKISKKTHQRPSFRHSLLFLLLDDPELWQALGDDMSFLMV
jgi:hypothetical protein